jgi:formate/nitrite transporter FocA (FNT family)
MRTTLLAALMFVGIGCGWFLCLAIPPGELWK